MQGHMLCGCALKQYNDVVFAMPSWLIFVLFGISVFTSLSLSSPASAASYSATLSTSGSVELNVAGNADGDSAAVGSDTLTAITTCPFGYKLSIQSSVADNSLYLDGDSTNNTASDTIISPINGTNILTTNTWGYSTTNYSPSGQFKGITNDPVSLGDGTKTSEFDDTELYDNTATTNEGATIPIYYGVKVANTARPGAYYMPDNGAIVYYMIMDGACTNYSISYDKNNDDATGDMNDQLIPVGNETTLTANSFTRDGYTFKEWNTEPDGTGDSYSDSEQVTDISDPNTTLTLFAIWEANTYDITIKTNTGISQVTITHGIDTVCTTNNTTGTSCELTYDEDYTITAVLNTGYTFDSWANTENLGTIDDNTATTITYTPGLGNTVLIPSAKPNTYTVTLNQNGATTNGSTSTTATYDATTLASITIPQREYTISGWTTPASNKANNTTVNAGTTPSTLTSTYTFNGWYKESGTTNKIASNATTPVLQTNTDYTDANGKWTSTSGQTLYAGWTAQAKTLPTITKTGYTCGWTETATNATTITYDSGSSLTPTKNYTLYGVCIPINYTQTTEIRYENADGTWGNYTTVDTQSVAYDSTYSWSTSNLSGFDSTTYQSASVTTYTVTGAHNNQVSIYRNTFTVSKQYKLQDTSGNYPSSYTADGSVTVRYGGSYTYSISATTAHQAASKTASNVTANTTLSVDVPRKTYTCTRQYRLQGADGNYPSSYTSDGSVTAYYGGSCSYTKTYTDYTSQTASASSVTGNQTLSVSLPRITYTLTVNRNTTYISSVSGAGTYRWGQSVSISATSASNSIFNGWSQTSGITGSFASASSASTTFTMGKGAATIYADGKALVTIATATYMQDVNSCPSSLTTGQVYTVRDSRDQRQYKATKLADGKCWMLDNLALDLTNNTVLNGMNQNNTNASNTTLGYLKGTTTGTTSDKYATAKVSANWNGSYSYSVPLVSLSNKDVIPADTTSTAGGYKVGGYYNYCAASAGSYCYGNGKDSGTSIGDATEDICPKGWRMPTGGSSGEYQTLYSNGNYNTYANYRSALHLPLSGYFSDDTVYELDFQCHIWSSTHISNSSMYYLYSSRSYIDPTYPNLRSNGYSVRCVLGS